MSWRDIAADFVLDGMQTDAFTEYADYCAADAKRHAEEVARQAADNAAQEARRAVQDEMYLEEEARRRNAENQAKARRQQAAKKPPQKVVKLETYNELAEKYKKLVADFKKMRSERDTLQAEKTETAKLLQEKDNEIRRKTVTIDVANDNMRDANRIYGRLKENFESRGKQIESLANTVDQLTLQNAELRHLLGETERARDHYKTGFEQYEQMLEESRDEAQTYRGAFEAAVSTPADTVTVSASEALDRLRAGAQRYTESRGEVTPEQLQREYNAMAAGHMRADATELREMRDEVMREAGAALAARHQEGDVLGATKITEAVQETTDKFSQADRQYHDVVAAQVSESAITAEPEDDGMEF